MKLMKHAFCGLVSAAVMAVTCGVCFGAAVKADVAEPVEFQLHAHTFDFGEAVNRVTFQLDGVVPESLDPDSFRITASASLPEGITGDEVNSGVYQDVERAVERICVTGDTVELALHCGLDVAGEGTLSFASPVIQRNMDLELTYTIEQAEDIVIDGETIKAGTLSFVQSGSWNNPETEAFKSGQIDGMSYYYYVPENADDGTLHPMVLWLHGLGEGGYEGVESTTSGLRANRAAVCFAQEDAQQIFGGAFVLAPQAPTSWIEDLFTEDYEQTLLNIVDQMVNEYPVDPSRIYICGASAGGYAAVWMAINHPDRWAAVVPVCPGITSGVSEAYGSVIPSDEELLILKDLPIWTIHTAADTTALIDEAGRRLNQVLGDSGIYSEYGTVNLDGVDYDGHWSWLYLENNVPEFEGEHIWNWMARQQRADSSTANGPTEIRRRVYTLENAMNTPITELYVYQSKGENLVPSGLQPGEQIDAEVFGHWLHTPDETLYTVEFVSDGETYSFRTLHVEDLFEILYLKGAQEMDGVSGTTPVAFAKAE